MNRLILLLLVVMLLCSCKKDKEGDDLASEPSISLVSIEPTSVKEFNNSIAVTIKYKDNNGDLGFENPDTYSLEVKDSRLDSADWYHVPPLAPPNTELIIEGQLTINLNSMFILGNGNEEVAALSIRLKDHAGNWSNVIITPNITISK